MAMSEGKKGRREGERDSQKERNMDIKEKWERYGKTASHKNKEGRTEEK